jgi:Cu(I)/Ag(I) efflux system membrane fusion protein
MKSYLLKTSFPIAFCCLVSFFYSCSNTKTPEKNADVFGAYIHLKNALVNDKPAKAQEYAAIMKKEIGEVKTEKMSSEEKKGWESQSTLLIADLNRIEASSDLKIQRAAFKTLSDNMLSDVKKFGLARDTAYHSYCPMYNDGKGGHWLSETKDIKNPYYGAEMLECGSDSGKIAPAKK